MHTVRKLTALPFAILLTTSTLAGCAAETEENFESTEAAVATEDQAGPPKMLPEAVQIWMDNGRDYCTGVLVSPKVVLTAAHCIWGTGWTVRAPYASFNFLGLLQQSHAKAANAEVLPWSWEETALPDVGVIELDTPIFVPHYPQLTDIGSRSDRGVKFHGVAVGRSRENPRAALVKTKTMSIVSGKNDGYDTGVRTSYYSEGGDSGGPLFLVEDGAITHKLVGLERQPDPERNADWFTRIDSRIIALVKKHTH